MPGYRVSKKARQDIREIGLFTQRRWGPERRRKYLAGMSNCIERLSETPAMAPLRREYVPPVRLHLYESHLIVYLDDSDGILIVRVLHKSMDVQARLSE